MWNLLQNKILIIILLFILTGCATTINTTRIIPAGANEVTKYKTVAFLDFTGNKGVDASSKLESTVIKANVNGSKPYIVVDRKNINKILEEKQLQSSNKNQNNIKNIGKLIGADALWYGNAESSYNVTRSYETRSRCLRYIDGVCTLYSEYTVPCESRKLVLNVSPKLSSVETGQVVYSKEFTATDSSFVCNDYSYSGRTEGDLYNSAVQDILYQYRLDIAPYVEHVSIALMDNKEGTNKNSFELLKNGIDFAKNNRIEKACSLWIKGLKETPESISLNYNIGVCNELLSNYNDALKFYLKAEDYSKKPINIISTAIIRTKENIENTKTLKKQM